MGSLAAVDAAQPDCRHSAAVLRVLPHDGWRSRSVTTGDSGVCCRAAVSAWCAWPAVLAKIQPQRLPRRSDQRHSAVAVHYAAAVFRGRAGLETAHLAAGSKDFEHVRDKIVRK